MNKEVFKENLLKTIRETLEKKGKQDSKDYKFNIVTIQEPGKVLNSTDDYMRLWSLSEKNINDRYFDLVSVVNLLSGLEPLFPIWINVIFKAEVEKTLFFELQLSLRFRKPSLLRNQETGHPPFMSLY